MIGVIQTGGTIGSAGSPLAPLPNETFRALWQTWMPPAHVLWKATPEPLDSTEVGPADWAAIAGLVLEAATEGVEGVVCLHGTDTLAHSAAALAMLTTLIGADGSALARLHVPVVVTGSMRPFFDGQAPVPASDARANAEGAMALAHSDAPGVHVYFAGLDLPGARVAKLHTTADAAFGVPNGAGTQPLLPPAEFAALRDQLETTRAHLGARAVLTVIAAPGRAEDRATALDAAIRTFGERLGAIHLLGYGSGNVPGAEALLPVLQRAAGRGVLIALGTQVPHGAVAAQAYASGAWVADAGAIGTGDMTAAAASAKLHLALALAAARGWDGAATRRFFATSIAGEISP